jgi:hypothetical protein
MGEQIAELGDRVVEVVAEDRLAQMLLQKGSMAFKTWATAPAVPHARNAHCHRR